MLQALLPAGCSWGNGSAIANAKFVVDFVTQIIKMLFHYGGITRVPTVC